MTVKMHSHDHAALSVWQAGSCTLAMQQNAALVTSTHCAEGLQAQPAPTNRAGGLSPARTHLHPQGGLLHPMQAHSVPAGGPQLPSAAVAGLASSGSNPPSSIQAGPCNAATPQAGGGKRMGGGLPGGTAPARRGFGGILSGVVKEAAETATKRPSVFRYEDFKSVSCC